MDCNHWEKSKGSVPFESNYVMQALALSTPSHELWVLITTASDFDTSKSNALDFISQFKYTYLAPFFILHYSSFHGYNDTGNVDKKCKNNYVTVILFAQG